MSQANKSRARDQFQITKDRAKERAQVAAQQKADEAKEELGRLAFDALEEYFPEQAEERRRENRVQLLAIGFVAGFFIRHFMRRAA